MDKKPRTYKCTECGALISGVGLKPDGSEGFYNISDFNSMHYVDKDGEPLDDHKHHLVPIIEQLPKEK